MSVFFNNTITEHALFVTAIIGLLFHPPPTTPETLEKTFNTSKLQSQIRIPQLRVHVLFFRNLAVMSNVLIVH